MRRSDSGFGDSGAEQTGVGRWDDRRERDSATVEAVGSKITGLARSTINRGKDDLDAAARCRRGAFAAPAAGRRSGPLGELNRNRREQARTGLYAGQERNQRQNEVAGETGQIAELARAKVKRGSPATGGPTYRRAWRRRRRRGCSYGARRRSAQSSRTASRRRFRPAS